MSRNSVIPAFLPKGPCSYMVGFRVESRYGIWYILWKVGIWEPLGTLSIYHIHTRTLPACEGVPEIQKGFGISAPRN